MLLLFQIITNSEIKSLNEEGLREARVPSVEARVPSVEVAGTPMEERRTPVGVVFHVVEAPLAVLDHPITAMEVGNLTFLTQHNSRARGNCQQSSNKLTLHHRPSRTLLPARGARTSPRTVQLPKTLTPNKTGTDPSRTDIILQIHTLISTRLPHIRVVGTHQTVIITLVETVITTLVETVIITLVETVIITLVETVIITLVETVIITLVETLIRDMISFRATNNQSQFYSRTVFIVY